MDDEADLCSAVDRQLIGRPQVRIGFVSTNSITQGEQVAQLWPILFDRYGLEISFAHRTFAWGSDARGKAHVHVVIIGLVHRDHEQREKRLFSYDDINGEPDESRHAALTPYLFDAGSVANRHLVVKEESRPINGETRLSSGTQTIDGDIYKFDESSLAIFLAAEPKSAPFIKPFVGAYELINSTNRWLLNLSTATPSEIRNMPLVRKRVEDVREHRLASARAATRAIADRPTQFGLTVIPNSSFLAVPVVSSERRRYIPLGYLNPPTIPSNQINVKQNASLFEFAVMTSAMHMAWLKYIGGRLKSDYRYSVGLVYNTFPWPGAIPTENDKIETMAQAILNARAAWPTCSLADLYDPDTMPANLRRAHTELDRAIDRLYRREPFAGDRDRVEHLFGRYEALVNPLEREAARQNKRVSRRSRKSGG